MRTLIELPEGEKDPNVIFKILSIIEDYDNPDKGFANKQEWYLKINDRYTHRIDIYHNDKHIKVNVKHL